MFVSPQNSMVVLLTAAAFVACGRGRMRRRRRRFAAHK
jgi:hypothetical protein